MQELQGPAYVLRRPHPELRAASADFHRALGLVVVRDGEHGQFVVAGDTWGIKTVPSAVRPAGPVVDGELVPVVHTRDMARTRSRMAAVALPTVEVASAVVGPVVTVRTPDGGLLGFAGQAPALPVLDAVLPDGGGVAPELAGTRLVLRRAADPGPVAAFYRDVVGLRGQGRDGMWFDLGEGVALEVTAGGRDRGPVRTRDDGPDALMVRVHAIDRVLRRLEGRGVRWLEPPHTFPTGTTVAYVADPEGVVLCLAERAPYVGNSEDIAAHDRWRGRSTVDRR